MSGKILLGIDGSEGSQRALQFAAQRAKASGEAIIVAYVIEWSPYSFNTPQENEERHKRREEELKQAAASILQPAVEQLKAQSIEAQSVAKHGHAAQVMADLAEQHDAQMIVVGRRGQSGLKALLFGSVAGSLVQIASVPVTVVP